MILANGPLIKIREAREEDFNFVLNLMSVALEPYYGGDHQEHARRIFATHISGGEDRIGHFSQEQKMFIAEVDGKSVAMLHLVGKRQSTFKISPLIVDESHRGNRGIGSALVKYAEDYAVNAGSRQLYCTVAEQNTQALRFFMRKGFVIAGKSHSHYKKDINETMLYKLLAGPDFDESFDRTHISVLPFDESQKEQVRHIVMARLPLTFGGISDRWIDALFDGYTRRMTGDINQKYKIIYTATDRRGRVLGVAGATPKKGEPIKVMPLIAESLPAFVALLTDLPYELRAYGHKIYIHIVPTVEETIALQQRGWRLDAAMPAAYRPDQVTQQWSIDMSSPGSMRTMRMKQRFLDLIRSGKKKVEVRAGYGSIRTIKQGEKIRCLSRTETEVIRVTDIRVYPSHEALLEKEDPASIAPDVGTREGVLQLLKEIYPPDKERLGIYVLQIEIVTE